VSNLNDDDLRALRAVKAILDLAASNFPGNIDVHLTVSGKHTASILVSPYTLKKLLRDHP
jgi:hypothetical protein